MSVTFLGNPVELSGELPQAGQIAPSFTLCDQSLADISPESFTGKKLLLNIFPSVDTPTCANSVRAFNEVAKKLDNTVVLCVSADLPFALARFVEKHNLQHVSIASFFRSPTFALDHGVAISDGALRGLATRAVIVLDEDRKVLHSQLVSEIADEPNYQQAIAVVKGVSL
ncbi:thiol peroxidase [Vibrio pectenicida]|uniref:Thiol peroxidase n=1 Tax=Vibrio pectenicida TaxID=62763 RepID=A0A3R9KWV7_9VIBR|nr:thiol peroxidase [Vibrio pectenicida]NOH71714.1 thiol peroxidase [Vibrio pectenicida]RSD27902.1 thiol peroxidase [Vibrio pectenicida]